MKKWVLSLVSFGFAFGLQAQDAATKKVQAGLIIGTGMNFQKMGTKYLENNGIGGDFNIGSDLNFSINQNIAFTSGIEFDFSTTRYKAPGSTPVFYNFNDSEIKRNEDVQASDKLFQLSERSQKATYLTIPTMFMFRTNFIGYFRYFGKFGLKNSFLLTSKINDSGSVLASTGVFSTSSNENMQLKNELFFYKGAVGLAGGAEWNFTGSTCLLAELGYYYGITPLYYSPKDARKTLFTSSAAEGVKYFSNAATQSQLMLKISILF